MKYYAILATETRIDITERILDGRTKLVLFIYNKEGDIVGENQQTAEGLAQQMRSYVELVFKEKNGEMVHIGWGIPK